jgi:hypothetical protein
MSEVADQAVWDDDQHALWSRIASHAFEDDTAGTDFTRRLARERGWSIAFASSPRFQKRR